MTRENSVHAALDQASLDALAALGAQVVDVTVTPAGGRSVVRITVDRTLTGVDLLATEPVIPLTLDECADATRIIDAALDSSDAMGQAPYVLEVSSPGVGRALASTEDFRRNLDRIVQLTLSGEPAELTGRLLSLRDSAGTGTPDSLALSVSEQRKGRPPGPAREVLVPLEQITAAMAQVEFNRVGDLSADTKEEN